MAYRSILTLAGLAAMAQAEAAGTPINLTHMAVGDGNGNPVEPVEGQTTLAREAFRAPINRRYQAAGEPNRVTAELVIPATAGGFTLREVGVFTDDGTLFAVGNLPDTYKPQISEGAFADTVVRMEFLVTNVEVVTMQIDPNVAVATQAWVVNNMHGLPPGGTTGQVLMKNSNADFDTEFKNLEEMTVVVEIVEETQTLAANQTVVNLVMTTTNSLALYVDGLRLRPDQWTPDPVIETRLTLAQSYPAGSKLVAAQNEPNGDVGVPLMRSQNLSDLPDKATARGNLGVYSRAETDSAGNPGDIKFTLRNSAPPGWLKANGAAVSRTAYAALFAEIGTTHGAGNGFDTFNLPDLRGEFVRGWDDGRGVDAGRSVGSRQGDANKAHTHSARSGSSGSHTHSGSSIGAGNTGASTSSVGVAAGGNHDVPRAGSHSHSLSISSAGSHSHSVTVDLDGSYEARPRNVALLAVVKY